MTITNWCVTSTSKKWNGWHLIIITNSDHFRADYSPTTKCYLFLTKYHDKFCELVDFTGRTELKILLTGLLL
jgi:hypothetical protein